MTIRNDDALRKTTADLWSKLNSADITPEMINCTGCRLEGVKTPYCESLCPIKQCAVQKGYETCGDCPDVRSCEKSGMILSNNEYARRNLEL